MLLERDPVTRLTITETGAEVRFLARLVRRRIREREKPPVAVIAEPPIAEPEAPDPIVDRMTEVSRLLANIRRLLDGLPVKGVPYIERIKLAVCEFYICKPVDLSSARRTQHLIRPRHVSMYLCTVYSGRSLPEIGRHHGGRDHTTILYAKQKIAAQRLTDSDLDFEIREIERRAELT